MDGTALYPFYTSAKFDGNVSIMIAMENVGTREIVCGTTSYGR